MYLLALERGKWDAPDLLERTTAFLAAHRPRRPSPAKVRGVYIEDKSGGTGLIQSLRRIVSLCDMPVIAVQRNRDKVSRVHDVVPFIRAGRLVAPEAAPWLTAYMGELADDQVDVTVDALVELLQSGGGMSQGMDLS